jgi:hypothetical protein
MIFGAIFLICSPVNCMTVGSPVFPTREVCERAVSEVGAQVVARAYVGYSIMDWKCVSLMDEKV